MGSPTADKGDIVGTTNVVHNDDSLFPNLGEVVESNEHLPTIVESLCMNCYKSGTTRLLLTVIPFFREVIISSFSCPHCGYRLSEAEPAGEVQERGAKWTIKLTCKEDFDRHVVKSKYATIRLEDLDFEIPHGAGRLSTIEGMLRSALEDLQETQNDRAKADSVVAEKVQVFISKLALCLEGVSFPITVVLDDPSGNSFIENPQAPQNDPELKVEQYVRSKEQNQFLGLQLENTNAQRENGTTFTAPKGSAIDRETENEGIEKEVYRIPSNCPNCQIEGNSQMCMTDIPYFKEIMIMAFNCEACGFKHNEVKGGGAISEFGKKISLSVPRKSDDEESYDLDMRRDVVKSTSAGLFIPEIDLEVTHGSLGGTYTTVEGLLQAAYDKLFEGDIASFYKGDSAENERRKRFDEFQKKFERIINGEMAFTLILDDPLDNSYMYSPTAPEPEPRLSITCYERTYMHNEEFGLNDMKTENYDSFIPPENSHIENTGFEAQNVFAGHRPGKVFKSGSSGIGYYDDRCEEAVDVQDHMAKLQIGGAATHPNADVVAKPDV